MSEVQLIIPLSAVAGAASLTAEGLAEQLTKTIEYKQRYEGLVVDYNGLVQLLNSTGASLEHILDEVEGFDQAKALRGFISELKSLRRLEK